MITRRGLITGLVTLVAAPAIVRATSIMPVKAWVEAPRIDWGLVFVKHHGGHYEMLTALGPIRHGETVRIDGKYAYPVFTHPRLGYEPPPIELRGQAVHLPSLAFNDDGLGNLPLANVSRARVQEVADNVRATWAAT